MVVAFKECKELSILKSGDKNLGSNDFIFYNLLSN